ncbi:Protein NLRC3 [Pelomyxa schiedti]|nr:Protein NLRC3 [Pelomyxa schiedti]
MGDEAVQQVHRKVIVQGRDGPLDVICGALLHPDCACQTLDLSGSKFGDGGAARIAQAISANKSLTSVNLGNNNIGAEGAASIARFLATNKSLVSLCLYGNYFGAEGVAQITNTLSANNTLLSLDISTNNIWTEGAARIAQMLSTNESLVSLNLGGNNIGDEGAGRIAKSLLTNKSLKCLYLIGNRIGDEGATMITQALLTNKTLVTLYLGNNNIGAEGAERIALSLASNQSLERLYLNGNKFGEKGAVRIVQSLSTNRTLVGLNLGMNNIGDAGAVGIAQALSTNQTLANLDLSWNKIGEGAASFVQLLSTNKSLVGLQLDGSKIAAEGAARITQSLSTNKSLMRKKLGDMTLLWFTWLKCPTSAGACPLVHIQQPSEQMYAVVGGRQYQMTSLGLGNFLVQLDKVPTPDPSGDLFDISIEIVSDCCSCSCTSKLAIANGKEYFKCNFCPTTPSSSLLLKLTEVASLLRKEFPQSVFSGATTGNDNQGTPQASVEGVDTVLQTVDVISTLVLSLKLAFDQEKELQMYSEQFTSSIDFSCMRAIGMGDINFSSAKIIGVGSNSTTSSVKLMPRNDWHIPRKIFEKGVALKMMFNWATWPGGDTEYQRNTFDQEILSLFQNPHWGVSNIISFFCSRTQEELLPKDRKMCLVSIETGTPLTTIPHNHRECVPIFDRTTFITQELGSTTLEKHIQAPQQPPASSTETTSTTVLPLGSDKTLEISFQLLSTIDYLNNKRGLFHLDIKSDNILMLERSGFTGQFTVLSGFDTSVSIKPSEAGGANPGMLELVGLDSVLGGNLHNRAPESLEPVAVTPRTKTYNVSKTDLWAIGCVVWQMCFGIAPPNGEDSVGLLHKCPCLYYLLKRLRDSNPERRPAAGLASIFVGAHLFLPPHVNLSYTCHSEAAMVVSSSPTPSCAELEWGLRALKAQTCTDIRTMMEQQRDMPVDEKSVSVRLFLQMAFLKQATPQLILQSLVAFHP